MKLFIIVPCYNEQECIEDSVSKLLAKYEELRRNGVVDEGSRIVLVNDGSRDATGAICSELYKKDERIVCIHFAGNFGHQAAVLAGYHYAADRCDCAISIDADLQQDIDAIDLFIEEYKKGSDIVYGVRNSRKTDGFFKKLTATLFYKIMKIFGSTTIANHADYRLLSSRALKALREYKEVNIFLRGIIPTLGFPSSIVHFDVKERTAGKSKYTLKKMMTLAANGITSFSISPIHYIFYLGLFVLVVSIIVIIVTLIDWIHGVNVSGYTTIVLSIWLLGALQLIAIGIIGEYIGKNYFESKHRPQYLIEKIEDRSVMVTKE